jgi:hypothetical protein
MTAKGVIIVEGTHDAAAYAALADRAEPAAGTLPPEAYGVRVIDGGGTGGEGQVAHLARVCRALGFRVVALVDYDDEVAAAARLTNLQAAADAVVRLPRGKAIEAAILDGMPDADIVAALSDLNATYHLSLPADWQSLTGAELEREAVKALKSNNGLHAQFIDALPNTLPGLADRALQTALGCCRGVITNAFERL